MKTEINVQIESFPFTQKTVEMLMHSTKYLIYPYVYIIENGVASYIGESTCNADPTSGSG